MIKINERFSIERDTYTWKLHDTTPNKEGSKHATSTRTTYPANLKQVCNAVLDKSASGCESIESLISRLDELTSELYAAISEAGLR